MNPKLLIPIGAVVVLPAFLLFRPSQEKVQNQNPPWSPQEFVPEKGASAAPLENNHLAEIENTSPSAASLDDLKRVLKGKRTEDIRASFLHLATHIERHPESKNEILSAMKSDAELFQSLLLLAQINLENPTIGGDKLLRTLAFDLVKSGGAENQNAAIGVLYKTPSATPDLVLTVSELTRQTSDEQVRVSAIAALESWAGRDAGLKNQIGEELIGIANAANGEARMRALAAIANIGLSDDVLVEAIELLWNEPEEANRSLLAGAYEKASGALVASTLTRLEQAFEQADEKTRRIIVAQIARIGKANAIEILQRLPKSDSHLTKDAEVYAEILLAGATTIAEIDRKKLEAEKPALLSP